ncbi:hypothetical protein KI387_011675, partial [Taxus chinensis]
GGVNQAQGKATVELGSKAEQGRQNALEQTQSHKGVGQDVCISQTGGPSPSKGKHELQQGIEVAKIAGGEADKG